MPRYIVKHNDLYGEWTTISDGMASWFVPLELFKKEYKEEHGNSGMRDLDGRLERVEAYGSSSRFEESFQDLVDVRNLNHPQTTVERMFETNRGIPNSWDEMATEARSLLVSMLSTDAWRQWGFVRKLHHERLEEIGNMVAQGALPDGEKLVDMAHELSLILPSDPVFSYGIPGANYRLSRFAVWRDAWVFMQGLEAVPSDLPQA